MTDEFFSRIRDFHAPKFRKNWPFCLRASEAASTHMSAVDGPGLGDHCARHALLTQYLERDRSVDEFHHATRDRFTRLTVVAHLELHGICTEKRDGKIVVILSVRTDESTNEIQ